MNINVLKHYLWNFHVKPTILFLLFVLIFAFLVSLFGKSKESTIPEQEYMPHKGYNFSMSYDAFEAAMERYAEQKISEWRSLNGC
jgi:F0F1-type ATP synthase membrane subunit a